MKFSSSFSQLRILLFSLVILLSSCEVLSPLLQREYKPITRSKTTIYSYNEFSIIPAGPMDTEESVFGTTAESATDVAVNDVEAQKKMIENKMNKARAEAIKKANEKISGTSVKVVDKTNKAKKQEAVAKKSEPEIRIIEKSDAKVTTIETKERQATKKASNVVANKNKATTKKKLGIAEREKIVAQKTTDKTVVDNKKAKSIAENVTVKQKTDAKNKVEEPAKKVEKTVADKTTKQKKATTKIAKSTKKEVSKETPKAYSKEVATPGVTEKKVLAKKVEKEKLQKETPTIAMNEAEVTEKGGSNLKSILRKRKRLKEKGEKIPSKAEVVVKKEEVKKEEITVAAKTPAQPTTTAKEISVKDVKIENTAITAEPTVQPKLKPFFYPLENLKEAKAYQFCANGYEKDTSYHLMKTLVYGGSTILITEIYNKNFEIQKITRESITDKGVFLRDYTSYEVDGLGEINQIDCGVDADESLSWTLVQGEKNKLTLNYHSSLYPNFNITKERQRALINEEEQVEYKGKSLNAIVLKDSEITTFTDHKDVQEEKEAFTFTHKFAEGVGLVQYEVRQSGRSTKKYELNGILSYEEWNSLSRQRKPSKGN